MSSIKSSLKLRKKESSKSGGQVSGVRGQEIAPSPQPLAPSPKKRVKPSQRNLQFDLFAQMTYMSSVATAGVSRSELFAYAAEMPYSSSKYFKQVHFLAQKLNIDYAEGCRMIADKTNVYEVKSFLLRLAGALSSGESEDEFLLRESEVMAEGFGNRYERDVESLKKWTDAYVTLVVAAGLIVIVSVISMMIYQVGTSIIVGLAMTMVFVTCLGGWIIYISAPHEVKTRVRGPTSDIQILAFRLFKILAPLSCTVMSLMFLAGLDMGYIFLAGAALIFVPGFLMSKDDRMVSRYDYDIPTVVRVLGGTTSAIGTTVTEALGQVDRRSMGSLMPAVTRLRFRLEAGIKPKTCWDRFVDETGSELVERTVSMFQDALTLGAEASKAGHASSIFSAQIAHLRATRGMVASTFRWLILPLHGAMVGLLLFIPEIMKLFTLSIQESAKALTDSSSSTLPNSSVPIGELFTFGNIDLGLVTFLVSFVVIVLTGANAFAPKAAEGGNNLKIAYNLSIMMIISGVLMIVVPLFARSIFQSIVTT